MIVVPDASIVLKWVLQREQEPDTPQALRVLETFLAQRIEIRLPTLWRYEVGNILGLKEPQLARELMATLLSYEFREEQLERHYCLDVLDHMRQVKGVTFYDSAYHVLALRLQGEYVTADQGYSRRAKRKGGVRLLSEWKAPRDS